MKTETIYREGDFVIKRHHGLPDHAFDFLDSIAWGTEGALYEHKNTKEHARQIHNPMLMALYEHEQIVGTALFSNTPVWVAGQTFNCYYIRYFAASPSIRGRGLIKRYSAKMMDLIRTDEKTKTIFFASVEGDNKASYQVVKSVGYTEQGTVKTMGFSRFFPRTQPRIDRINSEQSREEVRTLLHGFYDQHALVQFNALFLKDNYFVIRKNGEIVAGCQYHRAHWVVNNMKGFMGKIILNVVPIVPVLNQLFNPQRFEFLAFEGIYCKPGQEAQLYQLFAGLLAREKLKSSLFWMGENCPVRKRIEAKGKLGLIHTFVKDSDVFILASCENMSGEEQALVKDSPLYASSFDYI